MNRSMFRVLDDAEYEPSQYEPVSRWASQEVRTETVLVKLIRASGECLGGRRR